LGVVIWDAQINQVTHLYGSQAVAILEQSRKSASWKKEGLLVGEVAYRITIPSTKKSKRKTEDQSEQKPSQEDGWCLTNTIQLAPDQAQQFVSFLERYAANLERVVMEETAERRRILGKAYSLILSWADERKKETVASDSSKVVPERDAEPKGAVSIPQGKYFTISQVAEICAVKERTVSDWLKKGLVKGITVPGLGQIVEEKEIKRYLARSRITS